MRARDRHRVVVTAGTREAVSSVATIQVVKRAANVKLVKSNLKAGKKPVIKVRGSIAGTVKVKVSQGKRSWTRTVVVAQGRTTKVKFGTKLRRGNVKVSLVLTPHSEDHEIARTTKAKLKVRR